MTTPSDPDRGPSRRIVLAATLLREGHNLDQVADLTGVPVALLTLAQEGLEQQRRTGRPPRRTHARRPLATVALVELGAILNTIGAILALTRHSTGLALLSGAGALLLTVTLWLIARRRTTKLSAPSRSDASVRELPAWPIHRTHSPARPRIGHGPGRGPRPRWDRP